MVPEEVEYTADLNSAIIASLFAMFTLAAGLGVMRFMALVHLKFEDNIAMPVRLLIGLLSIAMFGYIPGLFIGAVSIIASMEGVIAFITTLAAVPLLYFKILSLPEKADRSH